MSDDLVKAHRQGYAQGKSAEEALRKAMADRIEELEAENARLREALTPSGDTKAAYISEIECDCPTETWRHNVPWTSIKEIMKMIRARATLKGNNDD